MRAYVLLGLCTLNQTKAIEEGSELLGGKYREAVWYLQVAFKSFKTVCTSAIALVNQFIASSNWSNVRKSKVHAH